MFPTLSEAVTQERLTVGPPFFNKWMLPIGLMLLLLTGTAPAARVAQVLDQSNLAHQFAWPSAATMVTGAARLRAGVHVWAVGLRASRSALRHRRRSRRSSSAAHRSARVRPAPTSSPRWSAL